MKDAWVLIIFFEKWEARAGGGAAELGFSRVEGALFMRFERDVEQVVDGGCVC